MWVFDGESWESDNASDELTRRKQSNEEMQSHFEEFYPELQVVEIVPVPKTNYDVPPLPLP